MSGHTPGPWECHKRLPLIHHWKQGPDDTTGNVLIAECGDHSDKELWPYNRERWMADARLIAAAPELLEALEGLLRHSCVADAAPEDKDGEDHMAESRARAVIARTKAQEKSDAQ